MAVAKKTKVSITKPPKTAQRASVDIPDIEVQEVKIHIQGITPLIVNNFSEKTKTELEDKRKGEAVAPRAHRVPEDEFQLARILDEKNRDCLPSRWFKAALVTAASLTNKMVSGTTVKRTVFVLGDLEPIVTKSGPRLRKDMVRVGKWGSKQPDIRYRAEFTDWAVTFRVQFEPSLVSLPQLIYLVRRAGYNVGLCEWRPEKSGEFGRFEFVA